jgi:hypothetical protein
MRKVLQLFEVPFVLLALVASATLLMGVLVTAGTASADTLRAEALAP